MATLELTRVLAPRGPAGALVLTDDLAVALAGDAAAKDAFEALPFSARKEFAVWVGGAKRADTRARRLEDTLRLLHEGKRLS